MDGYVLGIFGASWEHFCFDLEKLSLSKPPSWIGVGKKNPLKKRGTILETKLLNVRHMSRSKSFYLDLVGSISKLVFLNVCSPPHIRLHVGPKCWSKSVQCTKWREPTATYS